MNINQLETFMILADCLNVTETAERLNCTQPAVSARIRGLEDTLGVTLFDRIGKRMHLTASGQVYYDYAGKVLGMLRSANEHLRQIDDPLNGTIHFGASNFIGIYLVPPFLGQYRKTAPLVEFQLDISPSVELLEKLDTNMVEFLIVSDQVELGPHHRYRDVCKDDMVLVVPPEHPFNRTGRCRLDDLAPEIFLIKDKSSATRDFLLGRIHQQGRKLAREMRISSTEAIKRCVINGLGISILSRCTISDELAAGKLFEVVIEDAEFRRGIRVVYRKDKMLSPAAELFIQTLVDGGWSA